MRKALFLLLALVVCNMSLQAQAIRVYTAIIKTKKGTEKGILNQVTPEGLIIDNGEAIIMVKAIDIKSVRIKASKTPYKYRTYAKYDPWADSEFEKLPHSDVKVRKWGKADPTLKEEVNERIANTMVNGAANLIAAPIASINSSILKVKINHNPDKYIQNKDELYYHSIIIKLTLIMQES